MIHAEIETLDPEMPVDSETKSTPPKVQDFVTVTLPAQTKQKFVTCSPPAPPTRVHIGSLRDGRLRVRAPIVADCRTEEKNIVLEAVELNEFGFGESIPAAIEDLQRTIAELYFTLEQEQERLGPDLQDLWSVLRQKVVRIVQEKASH